MGLGEVQRYHVPIEHRAPRRVHDINRSVFVEGGDQQNLSTGSNGGDIATLLDSKDVDIGFLGAPPATIKTINGEHIKV